mmetsp:Transcript_63390/g.159867  ORF Transcript_63390/g.159867 Transcript_63390/m.159867 type:complete len:329 (+) Transcript_63390:446-1432(+)
MPLLLMHGEVRQSDRQKQLDGAPLPVLRPPSPITDRLVVPRWCHRADTAAVVASKALVVVLVVVADVEGAKGSRAEKASELLGGIADLAHDRGVQVLPRAEARGRVLALRVEEAGVLLMHHSEDVLVRVLVASCVPVGDRPRQVAPRLLEGKGLLEAHRRAERGHGVAEVEKPVPEEQRQSDVGVDRHPGQDPPQWSELLIVVHSLNEVQVGHGPVDGCLLRGVQAVAEDVGDTAEPQALHQQRRLHQRGPRQLGRDLVFEPLVEAPPRAEAEAAAWARTPCPALPLLEAHAPGPDHRVVGKPSGVGVVIQLDSAGVDDHGDVVDCHR